MPGAIGGITSMVQELLLHIETWRSLNYSKIYLAILV